MFNTFVLSVTVEWRRVILPGKCSLDNLRSSGEQLAFDDQTPPPSKKTSSKSPNSIFIIIIKNKLKQNKTKQTQKTRRRKLKSTLELRAWGIRVHTAAFVSRDTHKHTGTRLALRKGKGWVHSLTWVCELWTRRVGWGVKHAKKRTMSMCFARRKMGFLT